MLVQTQVKGFNEFAQSPKQMSKSLSFYVVCYKTYAI